VGRLADNTPVFIVKTRSCDTGKWYNTISYRAISMPGDLIRVGDNLLLRELKAESLLRTLVAQVLGKEPVRIIGTTSEASIQQIENAG
jgi:hypothetical protein